MANIAAPNDANWVDLFFGSTFDPSNDQQSTAGADLVGSGDDPLVRTQKVVAGGETIFFYQVRMGTLSNGNASASFYLALDVDGAGELPVADMFVEAGFSIIGGKLKKANVAFHQADFSGGNIGVSPNTTAWLNSTNNDNIEYELLSRNGNSTSYTNSSAFMGIASTGSDLDSDGANEWWVTFGFTLKELQDWAHNGISAGGVSVNANNISSSAVDADTSLALFGFTSTSQTANGDVAGVDDRTANLDDSWLELGVVINTSLNGAASGAPSSPTVNRLTTADTTPTVTGTALLTNDDSLAVVIDGVTYTTANGLTLTALNGTTTYTWSITLPGALAANTYDVQATTTRSVDGTVTTASDTSTNELVIDLSLPTQIPTINTYTDDQSANTGDYSSGSRTNDTSPLLNGVLDSAMDSGDVLRIYRSDDGGASYSLLGNASVSDTSWTYQDSSLIDGTTYLYKAVVFDSSVEGQRSSGFYLTVDTSAPTQTVAISNYTDDVGTTGNFASGTSTDDSSPELNGTLSASLGSGETLKIYRDGTYIGDATVETTLDGNGDITGYVWSYQDSSISSGAHSYTARVVDGAGNQGAESAAFLLTLIAPGITITPNAGNLDGSGKLITTEAAGGSNTFTVALDSAPTADVTVTLSGLDGTEGTLSTTTLTFTAANWNTAQTVTVTGADDTLDDGDISYTLTATANTAGGYNGETQTVDVINQDDDSAGITITKTGTTSGASLLTTEAGASSTFTVELDSEPTAPVTVTLSGLDGTEGSLNTTTLTFTAANWNTAQTVTVTGADDTLDDGDISYTLTATANTAGGYNGETQTVDVINQDDDSAPTLSIDDVTVAEGAGTASFTVTRSGATGDTTTVDYATAGGTATSDIDFTAASGTLSFAPGVTTQTITVSITDDLIVEGNEGFTVGLSNPVDATSSAESITDTSGAGTITDNDSAAGITIIKTGTTSGASLLTTEAGASSTFTVALDSAPTADVTVTLSGLDGTEGTLSTTTLTFTAANWNTAQTVTVTGVNDDIDDGDISYTLTATANNAGGYSGETQAVEVLNLEVPLSPPDAPVITDVLDTSQDPTPFDLLTGEISQVIQVTASPAQKLKLYGSDGREYPGISFVEYAPGQYSIDATGYALTRGDYYVTAYEAIGIESAASNTFTVDSTPELFEKASLREVNDTVTGYLFVMDQARKDLSGYQYDYLPSSWRDSDGQSVVFNVFGSESISATRVRAALENGASIELDTQNGQYWYTPSSGSVLDVFTVSVRDPGGFGADLDLSFDAVDLNDRDGVLANVEDLLARVSNDDDDLNNDGVSDSLQNSVTNFLWQSKALFETANTATEDTVATESVVNISVTGIGGAINERAQLLSLEVTDFDSTAPITLAPGEEAWDPLTFELVSLESLGLEDIDTERAGLQSEFMLDLSNANINESDFLGVRKFVSRELIFEAKEKGIALVTLDGTPLTEQSQAGWYSFDQLSGDGDGAVSIIENGIVKKVIVTLTDNQFGDSDLRVGSFKDPITLVFKTPKKQILVSSNISTTNDQLFSDAAPEASVPMFYIDPEAEGAGLDYWHNSLTGDDLYLPAGMLPPYPCYEKVASNMFSVLPAGQGIFDVHLYLNENGSTLLLNQEQARVLRAADQGYEDLGAVFASSAPLSDQQIQLIGIQSELLS